jgi:hypothetical protein
VNVRFFPAAMALALLPIVLPSAFAQAGANIADAGKAPRTPDGKLPLT